MKSIGPYLQVSDDYVPNMQAAYETDNEGGSHSFNNIRSAELNSQWPTVVAMAALIEQEWGISRKQAESLSAELQLAVMAHRKTLDMVITRLQTLAVCANLKCDSCKALIAETIADIRK